MMEEKPLLNSSFSAGLICFVIFMLEIIGLVYTIFIGTFYLTMMEIFYLIFLLYVMYKTLYQKERLTIVEWFGVVAVVLICIYSVIVGFIFGYYGLW